jgi:hypothetical protein
MKAPARILSSAAVCAALVAGGIAVAAPASAVTWTTAKKVTLKAADVNGYKAVIKPSGFSVPAGYVAAGSTVTVKRTSGTTVARNVASYRAPAGSYVAYSTIRYKKRIPYTATRTVNGTLTELAATSCTVLADPAPVVGVTTTAYALDCAGTGLNPVGTRVAAQFAATVDVDNTVDPQPAVDDVLDPESPLWAGLILPADAPGSWQESYTAYRYGPVQAKFVKRSVTVVKANTGYITVAEWKAVKPGMTRAKVAAVLGQDGYFYGSKGSLTQREYFNCYNAQGNYIGWTKSVVLSPACVQGLLFEIQYRDGKLSAKRYMVFPTG